MKKYQRDRPSKERNKLRDSGYLGWQGYCRRGERGGMGTLTRGSPRGCSQSDVDELKLGLSARAKNIHRIQPNLILDLQTFHILSYIPTNEDKKRKKEIKKGFEKDRKTGNFFFCSFAEQFPSGTYELRYKDFFLSLARVFFPPAVCVCLYTPELRQEKAWGKFFCLKRRREKIWA